MEKYFKDQDKLKHFINSVEKIDTDNNYRVLSERVRRHKRKRIIRVSFKYAAMILLVLSLPYLFYKLSFQNQNETISKVSLIKPCPNDAKIVFEDGKQISLSSSIDTSILNNSGIVFDKESSTISYKENGNEVSNISIPKRIVVPRGAEINVLLSDGTKVYLNSDSELEFPKNFVGKYRKVKMKGEAFFKVKKDSSHPFIVELDDMYIRVTGTEFNVKAYSDEDKIQTTLVEGGVDVYYGIDRKRKVSIIPSEQAELFKKNQDIKVRKVDIEFYTAWLGQKFVFKDQTLEEIMLILSRWYDINVFFQNPELKDIVFSGELNRYDNINTILDCIKKTGGVDVKIDDKTVILRKKWGIND